MEHKQKISIVTPCYNAEKYIEETVLSVLQQTAVLSKRADLEYIICDGNSKDRTTDIVRMINSPFIKLLSEPDKGMYDALVKGLKLVTGDIVAYINAGDYYHKCAFDIVLDIFEKKPVKWITGYHVIYNDRSHVTEIFMPYKYRRRFFTHGIYGPRLGFLQQESTFWSSELHALIDFEKLRKFMNAGDYYLWHQFAKKHDLYIVAAYIGGFKYHPNSLTEIGAKKLGGKSGSNNIAEIKTFTLKPSLFDYCLATIDRMLVHLPLKAKKLLNSKQIIIWDHSIKDWT